MVVGVVVVVRHVPQQEICRLNKLLSLQAISISHSECGSSPKMQVSVEEKELSY